MGEFTTLYGNLAEDNYLRGKQFERVCKWYLENAPYYRDIVCKVWLWDDWEHKWGGDAGIDLVVEDHDGQLWAVQSKAYDPARAVTKKDVDKFLSESSRKWFQYRLLIATTDRLHPIAQRTIDDQEKKVGFIGLADLLTAEVDVLFARTVSCWPCTSDADLRVDGITAYRGINVGQVTAVRLN
jgi:predicted helicase